jgi:hypothetical protein
VIAAAHRAKAERIEASLEKCRADEYEAVIEATMLAGTHWFNVALHALELTAGQDDVLHAEYMTQAQRQKLSLIEPALLQALDFIERSRAGHVRGNLEGGLEVAGECRDRLSVIREIALKATSFRRPGARQSAS